MLPPDTPIPRHSRAGDSNNNEESTTPMKITFSSGKIPKTSAVALLMSGKGVLAKSAKQADQKSGGALSRAVSCVNVAQLPASILEVPGCRSLGSGLALLISLGNEKRLRAAHMEKLGGHLVAHTESKRLAQLHIVMEDAVDFVDGIAEAAARMALGAQLRAYRFGKYKTETGRRVKNRTGKSKTHDPDATEPRAPQSLVFHFADKATATAAQRAWRPLRLLSDAVVRARDLVNEPANVLTTKVFAEQAKSLATEGLKVEVLGENRMRSLGMNALLQVGRGSNEESRLVVMQWNGLPNHEKAAPIVVIGKGVCFDSGGISLKPAANMGDMKGDMAGAACVVSLMRLLAERKAPVHVVGIAGLVENMINGEAQRPGDIVTSMSGQTIEVLNTDAEGRLVLCDAIHYARERFAPEAIIDLATLTGAILVCLGHERAGLFSNDDMLAEELFQAGEKEGEPLWRLPMGACYDKLIDSPVADMKNIGGRTAGSIVAAQFLARFVGDVSWAHLDIAGTAIDSLSSPTNSSWANGYGVRLLNRFLIERFERKERV